MQLPFRSIGVVPLIVLHVVVGALLVVITMPFLRDDDPPPRFDPTPPDDVARSWWLADGGSDGQYVEGCGASRLVYAPNGGPARAPVGAPVEMWRLVPGTRAALGITGVAFLPDNRTVAWASADQVTLYDTGSRALNDVGFTVAASAGRTG
jgi:hypothetical protein